MNKDLEHLRLLSIFHYVLGGLIAIISLFPFIHLFMGVFFLLNASEMRKGMKPGEPDSPVEVFGAMFIIIPAVIILCGFTLAVCTIIAGRKLAKQKSYMFCFVVAAILCVFAPLGTILGVFTILVLLRDSVKQLFNGQKISPNYSPQNWK
jgi:hypothetical protein